MPTRPTIRLAAAVVVSSLAAAACTSADDTAAPATTDAPASTAPAEDTETGAGDDDGEVPEADEAADDGDVDAAPTFTPVVEWFNCEVGECADLEVPLDHADPTGDTIELRVLRQPALDPDRRIGSLIVHFGGPGADSTDVFADFAPFAGESFPEFDIVAWDQRGTGDSARIDCPALEELPDVEQALTDPSDGIDDEVEAFRPFTETLGACAVESGALADHYATETTARDLELLRIALGDDGLTFLGLSYGTQIGWVHASLFPDSVRAMVLDGATPPGAWQPDGLVAQLASIERTFQTFVERCAVSPSCDARDEGLDVRVERIAAELRDAPIERPDGVFDEVDLRLAVLGTLYLPATFIGPDLDRWLSETDDGDPSGFEDFQEFSAEASTLGAFESILCADGVDLADGEVLALITAAAEASPTFGRLPSTGGCDWWPGTPDEPPALDTTGAPTILVVGSTLDPATPYEDAVELDRLLADSRLLTYDGDGHTIVTFDFCIDDVVADYLVSLVVPPEGTVCRADDRARFGIEIDADLEILTVLDGSGADEAGVLVGDVVTAIDGRSVDSPEQLLVAEPGVTTRFTVERDGDLVELDVLPSLGGWG